MKIDTPIVFVTLEGDVKQKVITAAFTHVASYEANKKETCVIVKVELVNSNMQNAIQNEVKEYYKRYGKVKTCKYYKDGATVMQMITNN